MFTSTYTEFLEPLQQLLPLLTALALNKSSSSAAGIVALTPARCLLAEADTTARDNCAVAWRDRGEPPSGT